MSNLATLVKQLYRDDADRIMEELTRYRNTLDIVDKPSSNYFWYKFLNLYFIYPDVTPEKKSSPLKRLISHIDRINSLGCNALHILPFLESPSGSSRLIVLVNLSDKKRIIDFKTDSYEVVSKYLQVSVTPAGVALGSYGCLWLQK